MVMLSAANTETVQFFLTTARNNTPINRNVVKLNPKVFKKRVNPTKEPKARIRDFQGILPLEIFSCSFFETQVLKKIIRERNPRVRPARKEKKPGPGFENLPNPKSILCQQTYIESSIKNREENQSFLTTVNPSLGYHPIQEIQTYSLIPAALATALIFSKSFLSVIPNWVGFW